MAKDLIAFATDNVGKYAYSNDEDITIMYHNVAPVKTGTDEFSMMARPVFGAVTTTASIDNNSRGRGIADYDGYDLMLVNDDTFYYSGGSTEIFSAKGFSKELMARFTNYSQAGVEYLMLINAGDTSTLGTNDGSVYYMTSKTSTPTRITDADMPGNNGNSLIRGGVSLDGYFVVADIIGNIVHSDLDDCTAWTATNLIVAEREADTGVYIGRHHDHIFYLGTKSVEFFYNAANPSGSAFNRRQDVYFNTGCYHPNSVLEAGDKTYFIGKTTEGEAALWVLENFKLTNISINTVLEKEINALEYVHPTIASQVNLQQDVYLAQYNTAVNGKYLILTLPTGSYSIHLETGIVSKWYFAGTPTYNGGIADWTDPKIYPITASLNRAGTNSTAPNRYMLLNGLVTLESPHVAGNTVGVPINFNDVALGTVEPAINAVYGFWVDLSGTRLYTVDGLDIVNQLTMATSNDVDTFTSTTSIDLDDVVGGAGFISTSLKPTKVRVSQDGLHMLAIGDGQNMYHFTFGTAWDLDTLTDPVDILTFPSTQFGYVGFDMNEAGDTIWIVDASGGTIDEYTGTAWDISTFTATGTDHDITSEVTPGVIEDIQVSADGTVLRIAHNDGATYNTFLYTMGTAADLSTLTFSSTVTNDTHSEAIAGASSAHYYLVNGKTLYFYKATITELATEIEFDSTNGITANPDMLLYMRPWDKDTNERKKVKAYRILHYASGATYAGTSNIGIDWIDTDNTTDAGTTPAAFSGDRNIDIAGKTARIYRCGMTRERIHKITFSGERTQILKGLEIDYEVQRG